MAFVRLKILNRSSLRIRGFRNFTFSRSFDSFCGSFSFRFSSRMPSDIPQIQDLIRCEFVSDTNTVHKVMTGFIEGFSIELSKNNKILNFSGREITCDLIDSNYKETDPYRSTTLLNIVRDSASQFNLRVKDESGDRGIISEADPRADESIYAFLKKTASKRAVFLNTTPDGEILLFKTSSRSEVLRFDNRIILQINLSQRFDSRFREYIVTKPEDGFFANLGAAFSHLVSSEARATDLNVTRMRIKRMRSSSKMTQEELQSKANRLASEALGSSEQVHLTVLGWTINQKLLSLNQHVRIEYGDLNLNRTLLIKTLQFSSNEGGIKTRMTLVDPESFNPKKTIPKRT